MPIRTEPGNSVHARGRMDPWRRVSPNYRYCHLQNYISHTAVRVAVYPRTVPQRYPLRGRFNSVRHPSGSGVDCGPME
jgi:hypothetical protein